MTADGALASPRDQWAEWLLQRRHGGDEAKRRAMLTRLATVRDRVLERADLKAGQTLLDVGTGDGLIGFGAVERVGPSGEVVFADVSADLVNVCRSLADELGVANQCRFLVAGRKNSGRLRITQSTRSRRAPYSSTSATNRGPSRSSSGCFDQADGSRSTNQSTG